MILSMETKETLYIPSAVSPQTKTRIREIGKSERRSMSQQAGELIELGLAEYERRRQQEEAVAAGKTQISPDMVRKQ